MKKRRVFAILTFLLLGAIVNVAVAWGFAVCTSRPAVTQRIAQPHGMTYGKDELWFGWRWSRTGVDLFRSDRTRMVGVAHQQSGFSEVELVPDWCDYAPSKWFAATTRAVVEWDAVEACGWPYVSLFSWVRAQSPPWHEETIVGFHVTLPLRISGADEVALLPTGSICPGFAINTVFYAVILWVLFAAPFALRRHRRTRRGLCPACAYPVGDSAVCTECGARLRKVV